MTSIYQWYYSFYRNGNYEKVVFAFSNDYSKRPSYAPAHLSQYSGTIYSNSYLASNAELAFLTRHNGIYFTNNLTNSTQMEKKAIERKAVSKYIHSHHGGSKKRKW